MFELSAAELKSNYGSGGWSTVAKNVEKLKKVLKPEGFLIPMDSCSSCTWRFHLSLKEPCALVSIEANVKIGLLQVLMKADSGREEDEGTEMWIEYPKCGKRVSLDRFANAQRGVLMATVINIDFREVTSDARLIRLSIKPLETLLMAPLETALSGEESTPLVLKCADGEVSVDPVLAMASSGILRHHLLPPRWTPPPVEHTASYPKETILRLTRIMASREMPRDVTPDEVDLMHMLCLDKSCLDKAWEALRGNLSVKNCLRTIKVAAEHSDAETTNLSMSFLKEHLQEFALVDAAALTRALEPKEG